MFTPEIDTRITRYSTASVGAPRSGGIRIQMTTTGDEKVAGEVEVEFCGVEGNVAHVTISPESLERAAEIMRRLRNDAGDFRWVCGAHGYHREPECPKCKAEEAASKEPVPAPSLAAGPTIGGEPNPALAAAPLKIPF